MDWVAGLRIGYWSTTGGLENQPTMILPREFTAAFCRRYSVEFNLKTALAINRKERKERIERDL